MFLILEEEKAQREAICLRPVRGSGGKGVCGPWTGATGCSSEEKEKTTSESWDGNCDWRENTEGEVWALPHQNHLLCFASVN